MCNFHPTGNPSLSSPRAALKAIVIPSPGNVIPNAFIVIPSAAEESETVHPLIVLAPHLVLPAKEQPAPCPKRGNPTPRCGTGTHRGVTAGERTYAEPARNRSHLFRAPPWVPDRSPARRGVVIVAAPRPLGRPQETPLQVDTVAGVTFMGKALGCAGPRNIPRHALRQPLVGASLVGARWARR